MNSIGRHLRLVGIGAIVIAMPPLASAFDSGNGRRCSIEVGSHFGHQRRPTGAYFGQAAVRV